MKHSKPFVLEAAALLTALSRPSHIGRLCSWGLNHLSPRYNSNYFGFHGLLLVTAVLSLTAQANDIVPAAKQSQAILLQDATVHTVTNGVLKDTDVLLVDGKISAIGTDLAVPAGAQVLSLQGKQLYPGLVALANQLGLTEIEAVRSTDDTTEVTNTNPDVKAVVAYNADSEVVPTIRANGFSYTLVYPNGALLMGQSALMQLDAWNWKDATVVDSVALHIKWPRADVMPNPWRPQKPEEIRKAS